MNYITIINNSKSIKTLTDFANFHQILIDGSFTVEDLLNFEDNSSNIKRKYIANDTEEASVGRLETGTKIKVPTSRMLREEIENSGNLLFDNSNFNLFLSNEIKDIVQNDGFKPLNQNRALKIGSFAVKRMLNNMSVWIWSKTLGGDDESGRLIDVSPFVESVVVNNSTNGSNFSIKLLPIVGKYYEGKGWDIEKGSVQKFFYNDSKNFVSRNPAFKEDIDGLKKQNLFFHNVLSSNDVVFIQFETLDMEKERISGEESSIGDELFLSTASLPNRNFDLIGLIDSNTLSSSSESDVTIDVSGRDLMKLLIEDGCYFFPLDFLNNDGGFINASSDNQSMKRLVNGELAFFNAYVDRTIDFSLRFIINQLSNIEVCSSDLFQFYPDKVFRYETADNNSEDAGVSTNEYEENNLYKKVYADGIWNCIRLIVDEKIKNRRIVDSSISSDSGSLLNFVNKVCQNPFVEFYGETYGDKFYFIARKPPFSGFSINEIIKEGLIIDVDYGDVVQDNLSFDDSQVYSWYRLIPKGNFFGDSDNISLAEFPAVFFEEYAKIWGSRPLQTVSNYIDYRGFEGSDKKVNLEFLKSQAVQDLAFLIETNSYLPFTRKGNITIKGDRRIKKGSFIRYNGTNEIFYVNSTTNVYNFSINGNERITQLSVSRGMVEDYLNINNAVNYFNIIDLQKDSEGISQNNNFKVNTTVFNFFLKRKQFSKKLPNVVSAEELRENNNS